MKKIKYFLTSLLLLNLSSVNAKTYDFQFDNKKSNIKFDVKTTLHDVHGVVQGFKGNIKVEVDEKEMIKSAKGVLEINTDTLFTDQSQRDSKMKKDVLDTKSYPLMKFVVSKLNVTGNRLKQSNQIFGKLMGNLTIRGKTKSIEIPVKIKVTPNRDSAVITGNKIINFKDYNVPDPSIPFISKVQEEINISFKIVSY